MRYGIVGILNTSIGFGVIAALTYLGAAPLLANAAGYAAGLTNSFFMNRRFTFKAVGKRGSGIPFLISFCVSYTANLAVLYVSTPAVGVHPLLPQLLGMLTYNVLFFFMMRLWVFARDRAA